MKRIFVISLLSVMMLLMAGSIEAKAAKKYLMVVNKTKTIKKQTFKKAKKVTVKSSNYHICQVKFLKKKKKVRISTIATGSATVTVKVKKKNKSTQKYKYVFKTVESKAAKNKLECKTAFKKVNEYRKAAGVEPLEWSDVFYDAGVYRLKSSGFDDHANLYDDLESFFGGFYYTIDGSMPSNYGFERDYITGENLAAGYKTTMEAVKAWRKSSGHYSNMIYSTHKSAAIAKVGGMYVMLFSDDTASFLAQWRENIKNGKLVKVTVREIDGNTGKNKTNAAIVCYDIESRWKCRNTVVQKKGKDVQMHLTVGHTYIFYDNSIESTEGKVRRVELTITKDGPNIVELID
ncbi:MAG: CAP domain-containing protein [Eubacterium sp.]|nr:CAP domain-containing protein [Eubacterium sp.]